MGECSFGEVLMDFVFVGAGRLATQLACALHEMGHRISAVYSRTMESASALSERVDALPVCDVSLLPQHADAFIVAVKDSALPELLPRLVTSREGECFLHTAGSIPLSVFEPLGIERYGVLYPMQTFSKERKVDFAKVPFFIEASNDATLQQANRIACLVSTHVRQLSSAQRRQLHLAAVFACNFTNHCYELAARLLEAGGLPFDVMLPLIQETAEKVQTMHPHDAQTGPAVRYDEQVIEAQSQMLSSLPQLREVYDLLSRSIHEFHQSK